MARWIVDVGPTLTNERGDHYTYQDAGGFISSTTIVVEAETEDDAWKNAAETVASKGWTVTRVAKIDDVAACDPSAKSTGGLD